jgi:hypothetical protein
MSVAAAAVGRDIQQVREKIVVQQRVQDCRIRDVWHMAIIGIMSLSMRSKGTYVTCVQRRAVFCSW